jgi:hypothetical protein
VMLALCAGMIHLLLKLDRAGRSAAEVSADLARLATDFRADVHAASSDSSDPTNARILLSMSNGKSVEYLFRPTDVLRTVRQGEKTRHFEVYRRPSLSTVQIDRFRESNRPFIALVIDRPADERSISSYHNFRIEAELGKDRREIARTE